MNKEEFEKEYAEEIEQIKAQMMLAAIGLETFYNALIQTNIPKDVIEKLLCNKKDGE